MSICVHLQGGVGNQMFQFATGYAFARRLKTELVLDTSSYVRDTFRLYSLGLWRGVLHRTQSGGIGVDVCEQGMPYNPAVVARIRNGVTLRGYFQTEKYFSEFRKELQGIFVPRQPLPYFAEVTLRAIQEFGDRSVFITVRRTDYVGNDYHGLLPMDYYRAAVDRVAQRVKDPFFFIFSDEPEWCKNNFIIPYESVIAGNYDRTVAGHLGREDAELWLMRHCRHAIGANSSYSWWGAWLHDGSDEGRVVIFPKNWFGPKCPEDPRDIVPERWEKI